MQLRIPPFAGESAVSVNKRSYLNTKPNRTVCVDGIHT